MIIKELYRNNSVKIFAFNEQAELELPFFETQIPAGFPSRADAQKSFAGKTQLQIS